MANLSTLIRYPLIATATLACLLASDADVNAAHNMDMNDSYALHTTGSSIGSQWQLSNPLFPNNPLRFASRTQLPYAAKSIDTLVGESISGGTPTSANKEPKLDPQFNLHCASSVLTINAGETATFNCNSRIVDGFSGTLRLSLASSLPGAKLSHREINAGMPFTLEVPTKNKTQWGDYVFTLTAHKDSQLKQQAVTLKILPPGVQTYSFNNASEMTIVDNGATAQESEIFVPHHLSTFSLEVELTVRHSWRSDLSIQLVSPSGNLHTLHNRDGGSGNDINQHYQIETFNGESAYGAWKLRIIDKAPGNIGELRHWSMHLGGFSNRHHAQRSLR
ncbi:proprotein convertase P-domain-containing protein [Pseudoalteromonas sp. BDTF-M6]|uniref:proprotein convertase P-domain-containing protein n=1 Tax=Pseudoalteromonas sp. BDTF-M6 TaxID=2796132 RepID=UPI001BB05C1D|nr:proprotein convertase P-domain-containing protein [Pseudoalteromonas sp. BDTF-M6]